MDILSAAIDFVEGLVASIASLLDEAMLFVRELAEGLGLGGGEEIAEVVEEAEEVVREAIEALEGEGGGEPEMRALEEEIENVWEELEELASEIEEMEREAEETEWEEAAWREIERVASEERATVEEVVFAAPFIHASPPADGEFRGAFSLEGAVAYIEDLPHSLWHLVCLVRTARGWWEVWVAPS